MKNDDLDEFSKRLALTTDTMKECQRAKGYIKQFDGIEYLSCLECSEIVGCTIRLRYVDSVYLSMSKGATGGFEF